MGLRDFWGSGGLTGFGLSWRSASLIGEHFGQTISYLKPTDGCSPAFAACIGDYEPMHELQTVNAFIDTDHPMMIQSARQ